MHDEDLDALAAEYVLGTLGVDARVDAEGLIRNDPGFVAGVHKWERRLGAINLTAQRTGPIDRTIGEVAGAAGGIASAAAVGEADAAAGRDAQGAAAQDIGAAAPPTAPPGVPAAPAAVQTEPAPGRELATPAAPATWPAPEPRPRAPFREADSPQLLALARRLRRWRLATAACGLLALGLAALTVLSAPAPASLAPPVPTPVAVRPPAAPAPRLVAVLQQEPAPPAFLLTVDPASRTLTVRRVAARAPAGHSYQLWVRPAQGKPLTLGLVGEAQYTQRPLPAGVAVAALRAARYEVSYEPPGGSKSGAPSGPILFTGRLLDAAPPPRR